MIAAIVLILVLGFYAWSGYRKGFVRYVLQILSTVIAIAIAAMVCGPVSELVMENTSIYDGLKTQALKLIDSDENAQDGKEVSVTAGESFVEAEKSVMDAINIPKGIQEKILELDVAKYIDQGATAVKGLVAAVLATYICRMIIFVIVFILIFIILKVVIKFTDAVNRIPLIGGINHIAGIAAALVNGLLVVSIAFIVIGLFSSTEWAQVVLEQIKANPLTGYLYDNNLLLMLISKI